MIHPSVQAEPFGRTLVEALLVGRPAIATVVGAPSRILDQGAAETLVRPAGLDQLAQAVDVIDRVAEGARP